MVAELTALRDQIDEVDKALLVYWHVAWSWWPKSVK